jgi:hypothetical protein
MQVLHQCLLASGLPKIGMSEIPVFADTFKRGVARFSSGSFSPNQIGKNCCANPLIGSPGDA